VAFKVNYGLERAERNRAKQAKKDAKVKAKKSSDASDAETGIAASRFDQPSVEGDVAGAPAEIVKKDD
jgi:hypothetical protein